MEAQPHLPARLERRPPHQRRLGYPPRRPAFGYRFIFDDLGQAGLTARENRVWRQCSQQRLWSVFAKKRGLRRKAGPPVHDDHVKRKFTATRPNQLWLTDITEHRPDEGKIYLCAIKDVYSNKIVGYSIDSRMKASLAVAATRNAIGQRTIDGSILHSDRGSQFRANAFVRVLKNNGITRSMGRVGACGDAPRWSRSSPCCRRTSSIGSGG